MLEDLSTDEVVREKNITGFFKGIGVDGLSSGNIARIIKSGPELGNRYDSVPKIIKMTKADFLKVEGFKDKLASKIRDGIQKKLDEASLLLLMSASNIFGRGIGERKMEPILEAYPDILTRDVSDSEKIKMVMGIPGMAKKSAELFVKNIPVFIAFIKESGLENKLLEPVSGSEIGVIDTSHPLYKKNIVMTGFRDEELANKLKKIGAKVSGSVSKNTFVVLAKNKDDDTGKASEARKLNIPIVTPLEFKSQYLI
jgi:NAD-dependent DNA ligase